MDTSPKWGMLTQLSFQRRNRQAVALFNQKRPTNVCDPEDMARAAAKYVFAALLALLSTQAAGSCIRVVTPVEIVWCAEADQRTPLETPRIRVQMRAAQPALAYASQTRPQPDSAVLFQRPPPTPFLFS